MLDVAHAQRARLHPSDHADHDRAERRPPHPVHRQRSKASSTAYTHPRDPAASRPTSPPRTTYAASAAPPGCASCGMGKTGPAPTSASRTPVAAAAASATGITERARYSKRRSSTASSTADTGVPKVAAIPAAAPAASSVLRSSAVMRSTWPTSEPSAPPVAMIGPSAPNGPPVPMATAAESGFRNITRGGMRLSPCSTFSITSGMPWPRMAADP
jgi:hypothetical protein